MSRIFEKFCKGLILNARSEKFDLGVPRKIHFLTSQQQQQLTDNGAPPGVRKPQLLHFVNFKVVSYDVCFSRFLFYLKFRKHNNVNGNEFPSFTTKFKKS